ncbi:TspB virulence factor protein [Pseudogulbenkiania sp. NH8B]|uniref:virulence factor TspB C-terminal domain-related protein n=1 Tax=Pseudogulbenkiania sp. (strain NH8B) TaxID=748280 RepID=UPI0002279D99|nr:virulence factor TspB C-terminal domain-related protein [Pseudogulbenkiania sp. NH8B]BAK77089.1 TspB virulence factor protein [Pseudogulbenkiania sp. NH8B]
MNRHLRNALWFAFAFSLTLLAGYASAGWTVNDGYDHSGGNLNRAAYGNPTAGSAATAVVNGDNVDVSRSWQQPLKDAVTGATATAAINVLSRAPVVGLVNAAKSLTVPGLAMTVATTWLINQNWTQSGDNWYKPDTSETKGLWQSPIWSECKGDFNTTKACIDGKFSSQYFYGWSWDSVSAIRLKYATASCGYCWSTIINRTSTSGTSTLASDADLLAQMQSLVNAKPADVLKDLAQQKIELQNVLHQIKQATQALSAPKTTGTGTKTNPDGSTEAYQLQEMIKFQIPEDWFNTDDPIPVSQQTQETKTTNVYNIDNTVKTTTETNIKNSNVTPAKDPKTDCDKLPNSVGCADLGTPPDAPDIVQQNVSPSFSWSPFSLPTTCPQPQTLSLSRGTYTMSWQPECDFATKYSPLVIAFASLGALFIMFGMKNDG